MHPLKIAIDAAVAAGLDFFILVGGDRATRLKMGIPAGFAERNPLGLSFEAIYHRYSMPTTDDVGLTCQLSFDALYHCRIPWSCVQQFMINNPADGAWPKEWEEAEEQPEAPTGRRARGAKSSASRSTAKRREAEETPEPPTPDNVRQFRPRSKNG